jgi:hypothetical protein
LDRSPGILDWNCTGFTYDGHKGLDAVIRSFGEQMIGVPILAALDGVVLSARDGLFDMHTIPRNVRGNQVLIDHGFGRRVWYLHMKRGSVAVSKGQIVKAGQQIGMVGSSGRSNWPHLHFETRVNGLAYEPFAGPCRPGASGWTEQPPMLRDTYVSDFGITASGQVPNFPFDTPRAGTFLPGFQPVAHWLFIYNGPEDVNYRYRFRRPDGTLAFDSGTQQFTNAAFRWGWLWYSVFVDLSNTGTWNLDLDLHGQAILSAPFEVVPDPSQIVNRPPHPIQAYLDPAEYTPDDVVFCRVETDLVFDDPDYDLVRYEYEWLADGEVIRSVTHAGQADAIPHHTILAGEVLECRVTPSDGINRGETASTLCGDLDPTCIRVAINVRSSIMTHRRGVVPVVVFGSEALDVADLDVDSLRFGPGGAATAHDLMDPFTWNEHLDDVNLDGFMDVMTHYRADESGIAPGDESADLLGLTLDGRPLKGVGPIKTVGR